MFMSNRKFIYSTNECLQVNTWAERAQFAAVCFRWDFSLTLKFLEDHVPRMLCFITSSHSNPVTKFVDAAEVRIMKLLMRVLYVVASGFFWVLFPLFWCLYQLYPLWLVWLAFWKRELIASWYFFGVGYLCSGKQ